MVGIPGQYKHTKHFFGLAGKGIQEKISWGKNEAEMMGNYQKWGGRHPFK
jgi:hypothetical protein